ncbi:MAG: STAS domain-containing protein [Cyanobacteriota bacterium]
MNCKIRTKDDIAIIDIQEKIIDHIFAYDLSNKVLLLIQEENINYIAINFENILLFSSTAVGTLLDISKIIHKYNGEICLFNLNNDLIESIKILNLEKALQIVSDEKDAINYLSSIVTTIDNNICNYRILNNVVIFDIKTPRFGLQNSGFIKAKCIDLIEKRKVNKICLNFENVSLITSYGIGILVSISNIAKINKVVFCIYNLNQDVLEIINISMVDNIIKIVKNEIEALRLTFNDTCIHMIH